MDEYLIEKCGFMDLYNWQRTNLTGKEFVLHDGPPYANGSPHMGHTINKILKDITIRSKVINAQKVHYVPGWDCHGLPIELKALSSINKSAINLSPLEIRSQARKFAEEAINNQREAFISWGVMADWKNLGCYFTNDPNYIKNQLHQFLNLYEKGFIFRDFKPVHWSPSSRTALAEAELEYNEKHKSKCATVRFKLLDLPLKLASYSDKKVYGISWTTTPWTLVANQALAYSILDNYCLVKDSEENYYILAEKLLQTNIEKIGNLSIVEKFFGSDLSGAKYSHPITGQILPFLPGKHVNTEEGTGLVHTAPAHGTEDFVVALENKIPVISLVDEDGKYTEEAGSDFKGLKVLEKGTETVLQKIKQDVLHQEIIEHKYPYDWRTKKPIIFRASHQWFIDTNSLKEEAMNSLSKIQIYPEKHRTSWQNALYTQLKQRPYWCISRQRVWGVPIPVIYHKEKPLITENLIERMCRLVDKHGTDFWWELSTEKIIGRKLLAEWELDILELKKGEDILDIWFDSGISWSQVLPEKKANLYVEGMDQFTGWFQSSLLTSIALQKCPPFEHLFVHGFAVDENNEKMSKSIGNVVNPEEITKGGKNLNKNPAYGVDVLRWWVASHATQHTLVPVKDNLLRGSAESINKLRNVFKFLLGVLNTHNESEKIEPQYLFLDKYMLHQLYHYSKEVHSLYERYQYHGVSKVIINFITNDVSSIYCHLIKDRLYCEKVNSPFRLGALDVVGEILSVTVRSIAPIVPHLAEEIWLHHPENLTSVPLFHTKHNLLENWNKPEVKEIVDKALSVKSDINKLTSQNTWLSNATIVVNSQDFEILSKLQSDELSSNSELCDICQVSSIKIIKDDFCITPQISLHEVSQPLCKRCRRHPEPHDDEICHRCSEVINSL